MSTNCATTGELDRSDQESNRESRAEVEAGSGHGLHTRVLLLSSLFLRLSRSLSFSLYPSLRSIRFVLFASPRRSPFFFHHGRPALARAPSISRLYSLFLADFSRVSRPLPSRTYRGSRSFVVQQVIFFRGGISSSRFSILSHRSSFTPPLPLSAPSFGFHFP